MKGNFYLPGLDGLRAIASLTVVLGHIELYKMNLGLENNFNRVSNWGHLGVILFFVLSGFLITTLLLKEKTIANKISIKQFYTRRILRVWPLYFIVILFSLIIFNYQPNWITIILCGTIFPNIAHAFNVGWAVSPQIWSIGVEEQFYLFWPSILKQNSKIYITLCLLLIISLPLAPHILQFVFNHNGYSRETLLTVERLFAVISFDAMAIGALFSILYFHQNNWLKSTIEKFKFLAFIFVPIPFICWFSEVHFGIFNATIYSLLFAIMISFLIGGHGTTIFELRPIKFVGKISYGIYMYHWIIMLLVFQLFEGISFVTSFGIHLIIIGLSIVTAYFSYNYVEVYFLNLKKKFETV